MSYVKQNFVDGNVLTAAELNHIEDGIAAAEDSIPSQVQVDDTLNINGAADAKKVGEEIKEIKGIIIDNIPQTLSYNLLISSPIKGYLNKTGEIIEYDNGIVSDYISCAENSIITIDLDIISHISYAICYYDKNKIFINGVSASTGNSGTVISIKKEDTIPAGCAFFRYSFITSSNRIDQSINFYIPNNIANNIETNTSKIKELENQINSSESIEYLVNLEYFSFSETGAINSITGKDIDYANMVRTNYIDASNIKKITATIRSVALSSQGYSCVVACYDKDKNFIPNKSISSTGNTGTWVMATGTIEFSSDIKYIRLSQGNISNRQDNEFSAIMTRTLFEDYSITKTQIDGTQWQNKKWIAFGTSITDTSYINAETGEVTGKYVPYLCKMSGLIVNNYGIAGGTIGSGGTYGGSSDILNKILSTDVSDADLITLEGFVNDYACSVAIGQPGDTENTSIFGALYQAINYLQTNSHALVVLLTETTGREYTFTGSVNTGSTANYSYYIKKTDSGLYQSDYNNAIKQFADWSGTICIDCGVRSEINCNNPQYLIDHLHHTELGGQQYAQAIWNELKLLHPMKK